MGRPVKKTRGIYWRRDANGTIWWYYRIYLNGREQRNGPFESKTLAQDKRNDLSSDYRHGKVDPEGGWQRIDDVLDRHVRDRAKKKDQASQRRFCAWWKARCQAAGLTRVRDLSVIFLEEVRDELKHERIKIGPTPRAVKHKKRKLPVGKLAEAVGKYREGATLNRYFRWLSAALGTVKQTQRQLFDCWRWELESNGRTRHLSHQEETALLAALGPVYGPWARLAVLSGLRQAEEFRLQWKDVDLERGLVTLGTTKSGETQYVHLSTEATAILRSFDSWQRSKWVFPSENPAAPVNTANFYHRVWIPAVKRAGIEWARWHDLRHTFASRAAMKGQNETTIAALLRHSGTGLVKRYAHLNQPHLKQAVESVAQFGKSSAQEGSGNSGGETGKKPETRGANGERTRPLKSVKVRVSQGESSGAGDPD